MSRIPRWLAPAALAPAAALDAAWALGINGPPAHVIAQTLALPAPGALMPTVVRLFSKRLSKKAWPPSSP